MNQIQCFERWSRHEEMTPYVSVLEEWDDMVGDDFEAPDSNYLNPYVFEDQSQSKNKYSDEIKNLFVQVFEKVNGMLMRLDPVLNKYWENSLVNLDLFKDPDLLFQAESLQYTLEHLDWQKEFFHTTIPYIADIGLVRIDCSNAKNALMPSPDQLKAKLKELMPGQLRARNKDMKQWLQQSNMSLKQITSHIRDFVEQQKSLKRIEKEFPKIRNKIQIIGHQISICQLNQFEITKDDDQEYIMTLNAQTQLNATIVSVYEGTEKNIEIFRNKITKQLIPELEHQISETEQQIQQEQFLSISSVQADMITKLASLDEEVKTLEKNADTYNNYEETLEMGQSRFESLETLRNDLTLRLQMWNSLSEWQLLMSKWIDGSFNEINTEEIKSKGEYYTKIVSRCIKYLPSNQVLDKLRSLVYDFRDTMPVVLALRNQKLKEHHWNQIKGLIGKQFEITDSFTLRDLINMNVHVHMKEIQEISVQATQESNLEAHLGKIEEAWNTLAFTTSPYKMETAKDLYLITEIDDLFANFDELLANLNNVLGSRYLKDQLRLRVENINRDVFAAYQTVDEWILCQKNWIYLENIFSAPDIKKRLPSESQLFQQVDNGIKILMKHAFTKRLVKLCIMKGSHGTYEQIKKHKTNLHTIQRALDDYLETKRTKFPRFYFLSNDELLEIFAKANDVMEVQKHLKKCFDNIYKLEWGDDIKVPVIRGMISAEGEVVGINSISVRGVSDVELWLLMLQENMKQSLRIKMRNARESYGLEDKRQWIFQHPAQIVSTMCQIAWCNATENQISSMEESPTSLIDWYNYSVNELAQLTELVRQQLTGIQRRIVVALITQDVHSREIIQTLVGEQTSNVTDFLWQQQLRFYFDDSGTDVLARQVNAELKYGYEYLGATTRLVITPLTDRCWITITGALHIQLGASPAGPAGTGKTESTKDLAKGLGKFCVVFNCSEQIEYKMMAQLFSGLAQQGAWSCLDEFNRIDIEVLSVIAQYLQQIRQALLRMDPKSSEIRFNFAGAEINLDPNVGVFITMNPGYAGRTELPDNLKILFRPVAMMIPDYALIAEIMLFSEGFNEAKSLSKKMVQLYKLSSEQLSQQKHYDFGMRAVKSVLVMAGELKRYNPSLTEEVVLIRAMRDSNVPKFLSDDLPLFSALVQDLFPEVVIPETDYGQLQEQIIKSYKKLELQNVPKMTQKVIQLFETCNVRFGVMLVGNAGCGKTTCYELLQHTMSDLRAEGVDDLKFQNVTVDCLNPKAITMDELYGNKNKNTQEWEDGLASDLMRRLAGMEGVERNWIVFDGPVDALWIENMNTVLDDNMMLCLANGQRIKLRQEMRILFEVLDLEVASPATVSRCGMVYFIEKDLGWRPYVQTWIAQTFGAKEGRFPVLDDKLQIYLQQLFDDYIDICLERIRTKMQQQMKTVDLQLVMSLCNLLETFLNTKCALLQIDKFDEKKWFVNYVFGFAFVWSIGVTIVDDVIIFIFFIFGLKQIDRIDDMMRNVFQTILFPNNDNVFGFFLDYQSHERQFQQWRDRLPEFEYSKELPYFKLIVPTVDTVRYSYIMDQLLQYSKRIFLTGTTGVGKTIVVKNLIDNIKDEQGIDPISLIFSAQTTSELIQLSIESKLKTIKKTLLGANPGKKVVIHIDDINMPAVEKYGAQPPIELLRMIVDKGWFYDRKDHFKKGLQNVNILCSAAPPSGGRNEITTRFQRHFNLINLPQPDEKTLKYIFQSIMENFLASFQENVKTMAEFLVQSTIDIYFRITKEKLPIPSKFHYTFNLRDVSKVFQGLLMTKATLIRDPESISRLWIHESSRVFHDRLINEEDRIWFKNLLVELSVRNLRMKWGYDDLFKKQVILYGDMLRLDATPRDYEELTLSMDKVNKVLEDKMDDYNSGNKKMKLVFFKDAIEHVLRIARVFRQPRGNLMLIGVGGSGKQSLAKLTSFIYDFEVVQIEMKKNYNQNDFRDFLKSVLEMCGRDGKNVSFIFTDAHVVHESFLEDINNLINSGEVPNLWDAEKDRLEQVIKEVREVNIAMGRIDQPDVIYETFIERVRNCLHIILCMSPIGDNLRIRCRQFPSLVDCSTLDWFARWPDDALYSVAERLLQDVEVEQEIIRERIAQMCKQVHVESQEEAIRFEAELKRKVYFTPKSYLDLINLYIKVLDDKRDELFQYQRRLTNGLSTLDQANKQVAILKEQLIELQPQLEEQSAKVEIALEKVNEDQQIAQEKESMVEAEEYEIRKQAEDMKRIADEAQFDLNKVMPAMMEAERAVKEIDRAPLIEMRTYSKPPQIMDLVLEGVFILFNKKYDWNAAKAMMQDLNDFINKLINFDKNNISEETLFKLRKHLTNPNFNPEIIGKKVKAGKDLCSWCIAMEQYSKVYKNVVPKQKKAGELKQILDQKTAILAQKQSELNLVKENVRRLEEEMEVMVNKKNELEKTIVLTEQRLDRAEKLITLLADEGKRWVVNVQQIKDEQENLVGDVLFSSACISYCGPFTSVFRNKLQQQWIQEIEDLEILVSQNLSLVKTLGDPLTLREWTLSGLPSDTVSQDNSLYAMIGYRWPLLIDPQQQANKWIKKAFMENKLKILKFQDNQFINEMKGAIQFGFYVLIPDVPTRLEPIMDPILSKEFFLSAEGEKLVKFADSDIQFDSNFQLFMTTKDPNPDYLPDVFIKTNVINFTVTFEGLEDQLLADVVKHEEPEKERTRDENIVNLARYRRQIKESEKQILQLLENSKKNNTNIVDDIKLIETLQESKVISEDITVRIEESTEIEAKISVIRNQYKQVSIRGALLYFVVRDLSLIDPMYQYSLQYIQRIFNLAIEATPKSDSLLQRLSDMQNCITKQIFTNVVRGLFEAHKLIFSFMIAVAISKNKGTVKEKEWNVFLRGAGLFDRSSIPDNPEEQFISENAWNLAYFLDLNFEQFFGLCECVRKNLSQWENYFVCEDPIEEPLPMQWNTILSPFEKLLILKIFRPEKIMFGLSFYVQTIIGKFYLESPSVSVSSLFADSDNKTPIIFVLSQGADPTNQILNYANDTENENNLGIISLGQGQGQAASELIEDCKIKGKWVLLQNCHLAKTFMQPLELILEGIIESLDVHEEFRLLLTSMPAEYFPISVLQNGIKLTTEPPRGIKANLKRCFNEIQEGYLEGCNKEPKEFHKLVWGLTFFHSIIQERKKFGPLGWNKIYEFNDSDLDTSKTVLQMLINEQDDMPWDALNYVIGQINYGGRVTDDLDRHCLLSILQRFFNPGIIEDKFQFCDSEIYYIPELDSLEGYREYVDGLPLVDDPEVFGMHENANINFQMQESEKIVKTILSIQPRIGTKSDSELTEDEIVQQLVDNIVPEVPNYLDKSRGVKELFQKQETGLIPSLSTVLLQEIDRYNILLKCIKLTLNTLKRAISGFVIMSSDLDQMYYSLLNNKVPELWENVSYASLKPLAGWIKDLGARVKFLQEWLTEGNPVQYWISGFFFPQGFLTGVLQTHARKHLIAIDELAFTFKFYDPQKDQLVTPFDGVNVYGLFLEGASFDRRKRYLIDQQPGEMFYVMPTIYFNPVEKHEPNQEEYQCPVYKTSVRAGVLSTTGQSTNFILMIEVPAGDFPPDFWTLRGTALLTQLND